jgi:LppP/LprE lipoprotein
VAAFILVALCVAFGASPGYAQPGPGDWLATSPPTNWNTAGAPIPAAPTVTGGNDDPRCILDERWPESREDEQVAAAGWRLFGAAEVGWGLRVVQGLTNYDGMCRPLGFQAFVFAEGQFAGTISPQVMDSRTDGVGRVMNMRGPGNLSAQFSRYTLSDPLCCPSSSYFVEYVVARDTPLLVPLTSTRINTP